MVANDYPKDHLEVLIIDGMSDDGTWPIVCDLARQFTIVKAMRNEKKSAAAALNLGIRKTTAEIICRVDAHARIAPDYLRLCITAMKESGGDNVGGAMETLPSRHTPMARAIAAVMSHPFGVGNSKFRTRATRPLFTDTVFGGCYRREIFDRVGLFNEKLLRTQDLEFNQRLRRAGGTVFLEPAIKSYYYACSDIRSFCRHNFRDGMWSVLPFIYCDGAPVRWRHLTAAAYLAFVVCSAICGIWLPWAKTALVAILYLYLATNVLSSIHAAQQSRDHRTALVMPLVFAARHLAYGFGSFWGLATVISRGLSFRKASQMKVSRLGGGQFRRSGTVMTKRVFDIAISLALLCILLPVLAFVALAIKYASPGTILYKGQRVGRGGVPFCILKFRTMIPNAEALGGASTPNDDPRVTNIGRVLRRYKLDELPQLFNVLKGEMSLVGPRPEVISEVELYTPAERKLLMLRPGMTDWASIRFRNEGQILAGSAEPHRTYCEKIRPAKMRLGLQYAENHSLLTDLRILFATAKALLHIRGNDGPFEFKAN